jgi:hypothetical protein
MMPGIRRLSNGIVSTTDSMLRREPSGSIIIINPTGIALIATKRWSIPFVF